MSVKGAWGQPESLSQTRHGYRPVGLPTISLGMSAGTLLTCTAAGWQIAATADLLDTSLMAIVLAVTDSHDTGAQVESVPGAMRSDRSCPAINPATLCPAHSHRCTGTVPALPLSRGCHED